MNKGIDTGKVLLVEDDRSGAELLSDVLTAVGNEVRIAQDGREALSVLDSFSPDVILLDLQMPGRDGFELARLIRVNPRQQLIPIVMVSGLSEPGTRDRALECGADDFIAKPLRSEDVVLRVSNALHLLRMRREIGSLRAEVEILKSSAARSAPSAPVDNLHASIEEAAASLHRAVENWASDAASAPAEAAPRQHVVSAASRTAETEKADEAPGPALPYLGAGDPDGLPN